MKVNSQNKIIIYGKKSSKQDNQIFVREEDFELPHGEDYKLAIEELERIQQSQIQNKTIPSQFVYEEISLWWLIYQSLIPEFKKYVNFIKKFSEIIEEIKPCKIIIKGDYNRLSLIKQIATKEKIQIEYSNSGYLKFKSKRRSVNYLQKARFQRITKKKIEKRKKIFLEKSKEIPSFENKIVFAISTNFRRLIFDPTGEKSMRGEYIQQTLIDMVGKLETIGIDLDYTFRGQPDIFLERIQDDFPWIPLEILIKNEKSSIEHHKFFQEYEKIISKKEFHELFRIYGISVWEHLENFFQQMTFSPFLPFYLSLIDSLKTHFSKNKPKVIFLPYETGPIALGIISIFKDLGIKTIGVQHGYIYPYNPMYSQQNFRSKNNPYGYPIPDFTLLFGKHAKNLLVTNGYPSENLIEFGNPALFNLEKISISIDRKKLRKKYGIKENQNVILFTSGKLQRAYAEAGRYDYDEQIWNYLLGHYSDNENFFIILKPHPSEKNILAYERILDNYTCKNAIIVQDDTFELIHLSSMVISVFSSTMYDALCFKKPVLRVKFENEKPHILDNSNVIITTNLRDMSKNIQNLIDSNEITDSLKIKISEFIKEQYGIPEVHPEDTLKKILDNKI